MVIAVVHATEALRVMVARMLATVPMWAVIYNSEPDPADPLATLVDSSGPVGVQILWRRVGVMLSNSTDLRFSGVHDRASVSWIGICSDPHGQQLLAYGSIDPTPGTGTGRDWFTVATDTVKLVVN